MRRFEVYIDDYERLTIAVFDEIESEYERIILRGTESYDLIKKLAANKIVDFYEYKNRDDAVVEYGSYIINLNDCSRLYNKRGMGPLMNSLKKYHETKKMRSIMQQKASNTTSNKRVSIPKKEVTTPIKETNLTKKEEKSAPKRVKRKNKYTGKIIAAGIALCIIFGVCTGFEMQSSKASNINETQITTIWEEPSYDIEDASMPIIPTGNPVMDDISEDFKISIDYEDRSSLEKVYITKAYYGSLLNKYAKQYGVDPNLILAIATQERGIHSSEKDSGGATGLMQIQNVVWEDETIYAYNFNTQKKESLHITKNMIKDLETNIKIGCMYLQNCMEYMNYNVVAAVQCYNMGYGNMITILEAYSKDTNKSIKEILNDKQDMGWLQYRNLINQGDRKYIENVFSWLGTDIELNTTTRTNNLFVSNISNKVNSKKIS